MIVITFNDTRFPSQVQLDKNESEKKMEEVVENQMPIWGQN